MADKKMNQLAELGQSIWLDYISRPMLETGQLKERIADGLRGMTSNPSIFNSAIGSTNDYDDHIVTLKGEGKSTFEIYDELTIRDIQDAADCFKSVYESTDGLDGYVSLEINPLLADKIDEQAKEGVRLFKKVNRPNVMIKVPSTPAGFPVVEELIAQGINVNTTLIFSLQQYEKTAEAYLKGLQRLAVNSSDLSRVRSVASVFISRVDTMVDKMIDEKVAQETDEGQKVNLQGLKGRAAVANSRIIFEKSKELFSSEEFKALEQKGANLQRVLWGSTSTKNPDYNDVKYIEELIASPTVNTVPEATLMAFFDHGQVKEALADDVQKSQKILESLKNVGINIDDVCQTLLADGCVAFNKAFEDLLNSVEKKTAQLSLKH